jgi:hypothetical protein
MFLSLYNLEFSQSDAGSCLYKSKVKTRVLLEKISEAASFSESQLPTEVATFKYALLAQLRN